MSESNGVKDGQNKNSNEPGETDVVRNVNTVISMIPKRKNKVTSKNYKQYYRKAWEEIPEFREWLAEIPGQRSLAYCKICQRTLHAHRLSLTKHTVSLKHCRLAQKRAHEQHDDFDYDPDDPAEQPGEVEVDGEVASTGQSYMEESLVQEVPAEEVVVEPVTDSLPVISPSKASLQVTRLLPRHSSSAPKPSRPQPSRPQPSPSPRIQVSGNLLQGTPSSTSPSQQSSRPQPSSTVPATPQSAPQPAQLTTTNEVTTTNVPTPVRNVSNTVVNQPAQANQGNGTAQIKKPADKPSITTHVLDTARGTPAAGLAVSLYQLIEGRWTLIKDGHTNGDGRCATLTTPGSIKPGRYKLHFDTDRYFILHKQPNFFPFVEVVFDICSPSDRNHIPVLLSPFGYTTYKGS